MLMKLHEEERDERDQRNGGAFRIWQVVLLSIAYVAGATFTAAIAWPSGIVGWMRWFAGFLSSFPMFPLVQVFRYLLELKDRM